MPADESLTILVAEDDSDIVEILRLYLHAAGYRVLTAADGVAALEIMRRENIAVALVDLMMPRMNGFDFIRELRTFSTCPAIIVSARSMPADKVLALDQGADGYITKPFDPMEVTAYIRAVLRCAATVQTPSSSAALHAGALTLDSDKLQLIQGERVATLTAAEFKIMAQLMADPGRVFSKSQLYACVCGCGEDGASGGEASVMVHISNIRAKIEENPASPVFIKTVRGLGYRLEV